MWLYIAKFILNLFHVFNYFSKASNCMSLFRKIFYCILLFAKFLYCYLLLCKILYYISLFCKIFYCYSLFRKILYCLSLFRNFSIVTHHYSYCIGQLTKKLIPALLYSSGQTISLLIFPSSLGVESPAGATSGKHPN